MFDDLPDISFGSHRNQPEEKLEPERRIIPIVKSIDELNLADELLLQLATGKQLLEDAMSARGIDAPTLAQKAAALNAITAIITRLVASESELYNAERLKVQEAVLIETLKEFPDIKAAFLAAYKKALINAGLFE